MENKEEIIKEFAKYCSTCDGKCCKRGVFTIFGWEVEKLTTERKDFQEADVFDERGKCKDIAIHSLCLFSNGDGCKLPIELRPIDCVSFPFYPKVKETNGKTEVESILIQNECPFSEEISKNERLLKYMQNFWENILNTTSKQEIIDWIGENGCWGDWYKNAIEVKQREK